MVNPFILIQFFSNIIQNALTLPRNEVLCNCFKLKASSIDFCLISVCLRTSSQGGHRRYARSK